MNKNNINRWESTKLQIDKIILPAYVDLLKSYVCYFKELKYTPKHISDMLKDIADATMTSYLEFKDNNYFFIDFVNE